MNKDNEPLFKVNRVSFSYLLDTQLVHALRDVSLSIPHNKIVCFSGPSGSGKTTLLNLLGLIEKVQDGSIIFDGENFATLSESQQNALRRFQFGFIFQQFLLLPVLTAEENVSYFLSRQKLPKAEQDLLTKESLQAVGLWEHRHKKPLEMSGGQRQRVAIARALAKRPRVIIADEPTASLDQKTGREIMELLSRLAKEQQVSVIIASHDPMVHTYADIHYKISDGRLVEPKGET